MAKPGRVYWKGALRLSLVTIGVEIYPAVETASEISFNQIHKPSGKRKAAKKTGAKRARRRTTTTTRRRTAKAR